MTPTPASGRARRSTSSPLAKMNVTSLVLEAALLELQRRGILRDRSSLRIVESIWRRGLDLDRDVQGHSVGRAKRAQDLVGYLLEVHGVAIRLQALASE